MTGQTRMGGGRAEVDRRSPEATFALLGDDTRIAILRSMGEAPDEAVSFSALRERVGTADSGQFNYHLKKLLGSFVRKTDAGYELTYAGRQIVGAMHAGTYTANATLAEIPIDGSCPMCGGVLEASYADETAWIGCTDCQEWHNEFSFPPGSLDQFDVDELPLAFDRWMSATLHRIMAGFCNTCAGRMTGEVVVHEPDADGERTTAQEPFGSLPAHVAYECERCGSRARTGPATPLYFHPAMAGFRFEHGIDADRTPSWALPAALTHPTVEVLETEPPRLGLSATYEGERITAVLTADGRIVDVDRTQID